LHVIPVGIGETNNINKHAGLWGFFLVFFFAKDLKIAYTEMDVPSSCNSATPSPGHLALVLLYQKMFLVQRVKQCH